MSKLARWQRWGVIGAFGAAVVDAAIVVLGRWWWFRDALWFRAFSFASYPAEFLERQVLLRLGLPRVYDLPMLRGEALVVYLTWFTLNVAWWFLLGAATSFVVKRRTTASSP
jgi:hypothetical protein